MESNSTTAIPEKADWLSRFIAEIIDDVAWSLIVMPFTVGLVIGMVAGNGWVIAFALMLGLVLSLVILVVVAMTYSNGQSVGKRAMGTQVIRVDGNSVTWAYNFLVRGIVVKGIIIGTIGGLTGGLLFVVNYLWPLWDKEQQALHDKMASTYVVKIRPSSPSSM